MFATLPGVRLQKLALDSRKAVARAAPLALRLSGLYLPPDTLTRKATSLVALAPGLLWFCALGCDSVTAAVACFSVALVLRFAFLFASFIPRGVAERLTAQLGTERAHASYAFLLDVLLVAQRASLVALVCATAREPNGAFGVALQVLGVLLIPVGIGATFWAARTAGLDAYHYRDLFAGSRQVGLVDDGPYALLPNPMYTLGPLAGYGLALLALSPLALIAVAVSQALSFTFNEVIEQPRLRRANNVFVETQRRYAIAQSLLGFDPRQELIQLRHTASSEPEPQAAGVEHGNPSAV